VISEWVINISALFCFEHGKNAAEMHEMNKKVLVTLLREHQLLSDYLNYQVQKLLLKNENLQIIHLPGHRDKNIEMVANSSMKTNKI